MWLLFPRFQVCDPLHMDGGSPDGQMNLDYLGVELVSGAIGLSVVIPFHNEEENVENVVKELEGVLDDLDINSEILLVDDGSTDATFSIISVLAGEDRRIRPVQLARRCGQTAAFSAGIDLTSGQIIVTMDGDSQNDPADIPKLLSEWAKGFDVVSGWRVDRKDHFFTRRLPSYFGNRVISGMSGLHLHDYGCALKAYDGDMLRSIRLYGEMHRYLPAYAVAMGAVVSELPVNHRPRIHGTSKYGLSRLFRVPLDSIKLRYLIRHRTEPMRLFGRIAYVAISLAIVALVLIPVSVFVRLSTFTGADFAILAAILIVLSAVMICSGLLAEHLVALSYADSGRKSYVLKQDRQLEWGHGASREVVAEVALPSPE